MSRMFRSLGIVALISAAPLMAAVTITISPTTATVAQGTMKQFTATVAGSTNTGVTWRLPGGSATGTITTAGLYTAPATAGTYKVRATSKADTTKWVEATVTVPMKVVLSPTTATLNQGAKQTFTATVTGSTTKTLTWAVTGGSANGTITSAGVYTAPAKAGTYTITATTTKTPAGTASATVTVNPVGISVSPATATVVSGATRTFTAVVTGTTTTGVTWTSSPTAGLVNSSGVFTAPATPGTYTVTATSTADATKTASATVTVGTSVSVGVTPASATVALGGTQQLTATVSGTANPAVTWSVTGGAANGSVTSGGLYTAPLTAGIYTVVATSVADPTKSATATITVPVLVGLSPATATLNQGATQQFSATATGGSASTVTWTVVGGSTNGTITAGGLYTAPAKAGTYTITATSTATPAGSASATVTVNPVGISISPTTATVGKSATQPFTATVTGTTNTAVTWTTTGGTITTGGVLTAPSTTGTVTVTARSAADTTRTATATVTVASLPTISTFAFQAGISGTTTSLESTSGWTETLKWTASGATSLTVNQGVGAVSPLTSGSLAFTVPDVATTTVLTYTLTAANAGGSVTRNITLTVHPRPQIQSFTASATSVKAGKLVTLTPVFSGGTAYLTWSWVSGSNWGNGEVPGPIQSGVPVSVSVPVSPTTFQLRVQNDFGNETSQQVSVDLVPSPMVANYLGRPAITIDGMVESQGKALIGSDRTFATFDLMSEVMDPATVTTATALPVGSGRYETPGPYPMEDGRLVTGGGQMDWFHIMNPVTRVLDETVILSWTVQGDLSLSQYRLLPLDGFRLFCLRYTGEARIYDLRTRTFGAPLFTGEWRLTPDLVQLADGRVLISGGRRKISGVYSDGNTALLFDPATNQFSAVPNLMAVPRYGHVGVRLLDGRVLLTGGSQDGTCEVFDPATLTFTASGLLQTPRHYHRATLLGNGEVLVTGGDFYDPTNSIGYVAVKTTEVFSPASGVFYAGPVLGTPGSPNLSRLSGGGAVILPLATGRLLLWSGPRYGESPLYVVDPKLDLQVLPATVRLYTNDSQAFTLGGPLAPNGATWSIQEPAGGSITPAGLYTAPATPGTYHVVATSLTDGTVTCVVPVRVVQRSEAVITSFTADQTSVTAGTAVTLTPVFSGGIGTIAGIGPVTSGVPVTVTPSQTTDYLLSVVDVNGLGTSSRLTVGVIPVIGSFTASAAVIAPGENVVLSWTLTGASSATLTDGSSTPLIVNPVQALTLSPAVTTTYTLTVDGPNGAISKAQTVIVSVVRSLTITPTEATIDEGGQVALAGNMTIVDTADQTVTWTTDAPGGSVVGGGTNGLSAVFTAPMAVGTFHVTVTSNADPSRSATATLTVVPISLVLEQTYLELSPGAAFRFGYALSRGTLTWTCSAGQVAADGTYTAPMTAGTYTVTATSTLDPAVSATATVVVKANRVIVVPSKALVSKNLSYRFLATAVTGGITWSVVEPNGGSITADGVYTAPATAGTYTVKATATADGSTSGTALVTVIDGATPPGGPSGTGGGTTVPTPTSLGVSVSPEIVEELAAGTYQALSATVFGSENQAVTWTVTSGVVDGGGKQLGSVDTDGVFTASHPGIYTVKATSTANTGISGTAVIVVKGSVDPILGVPEALNREGYSVTALKNGKILLAGGWDGTSYRADAYLYDPDTKAFTSTGTLATARTAHSATLLDDGRVLIANGTGTWQVPGSGLSQTGPVNHAELYNPTTGAFEALPMQEGQPLPGSTLAWHQNGATATLGNGQALLIGGNYPAFTTATSLYDPVSQLFSLVDSPKFGQGVAAVKLQDGRVLVTGGIEDWTGAPNADPDFHIKSTAWIYDPAPADASPAGFKPAGNMTSKRAGHTMTLLPDGKVLIVGGVNRDETPYNAAQGRRFQPTATVEVYDPQNGSFTQVGSMNHPRADHAAILLVTGQVMVAGGWEHSTYSADGSSVTDYPLETEFYNSDAGRFSVMDTLGYGLESPRLALQSDGAVLITGRPIGVATANTLAPSARALKEAGAHPMSAPLAAGGQTWKTAIGATFRVTPVFGPLYMNQGVHRMVDSANLLSFLGVDLGPSAGMTPKNPDMVGWRGKVPKIIGRNTLFQGSLGFPMFMEKAVASKLKLDVYLQGESTPFLTSVPLEAEFTTGWLSGKKPTQLVYTFEIPAAKAVKGAALKLRLTDPSGTLVAMKDIKPEMLEYEVKDAANASQSPWKDDPAKGITLELYPLVIKYKDAAGKPMPDIAPNLANFKAQLEPILARLTPYGERGVTIVERNDVQITWDQGTRNGTATDPNNLWAFKDAQGKAILALGTKCDDAFAMAWRELGNKANWGINRRPAGRFACIVVPTFVGITVRDLGSGWGLTDNPGEPGTPQFLHMFLSVDNYPVHVVHELGHSHGLRHPEELPKLGTLYPGLNPYSYIVKDGRSEKTVTGIGSPGWDPFQPKGGFNSGPQSIPVLGWEFYNPLDERVLDLMQYTYPPSKNYPEDNKRFWISDYQFTNLWLYNQRTNPPTPSTP